jgi:hypothetical protein
LIFDLVYSLSSGTGFGKSLNERSRKPANSSRKTKSNSSIGQQQQKTKGFTYVKSNQESILNELARTSSSSPIGRAVADSIQDGDEIDPFWQLMPSLIESKFPHVKYDQLHRIAGFIRHTLNPKLPKESSLVQDPWRPHEELHAVRCKIVLFPLKFCEGFLSLCGRLNCIGQLC